jgi:membrane protein required for colicin V production
MNYLDIIIAVPLLWGLYKGFTKGIILEVASLLSLGLAIWVAIQFHNFLLVWMYDSLGWKSNYLPIVSFALLFIGVLVVVFVIAKLIEKVVESVALGFVNKLAGALFGMLKFGIIISLFIFILNAIEKKYSFIPADMKNKSLLYQPLSKIAPLIIPGLSESKLRKKWM